MEIAALAIGLMGLLTEWVWPVVQVVLALDLVIFAHELGHFLAAKAADIKVERLAVGLGPRLFGVKRGETDYCVCAFPIAGYCKMLGQEDFKPDTGDSVDPRAYNNKSVRARFLVVSAGVLMNIAVAAVLYVVVGLVGREFLAPVVGGVVPGMPAAGAEITWQGPEGRQAPAPLPAGPAQGRDLRPGDEVLRIEGDSVLLWLSGNRIASFSDLMMTAALADPENKYTFTIQRQIDGQTWVGTTQIGVRERDGLLGFGIYAPLSTVIAEWDEIVSAPAFQPGDKVVAIDGRKIDHHWQIRQVEKDLTGGPVAVTVVREDKKVNVPVRPVLTRGEDVLWLTDGTSLHGRVVRIRRAEGEPVRYDVRLTDGSLRTVADDELDTTGLRILGMIPRLEVLAVAEGTPAHRVGLKPGDIVLAYGERATPTIERLREINKEVAEAGATLRVLRGEEIHEFDITPQKSGEAFEIGIFPGMDLDHLVVAEVRDGSAADRAGVVPGAKITSVNGRPVNSWIGLFTVLAGLDGKEIRVGYEHNGKAQTARIASLDRALFDPSDYRFQVIPAALPFEVLTVRIRQDGIFSALGWGCKETVKMVLTSYATLRSLIRGTTSGKAISGPVGIGSAAVSSARKGLIHLVYLMAIISAALAVFNFLPIPVLDGGLAVFLLIEKILRRPVPTKVLIAAQVFGWVVVLGIFIAVTWNDVARLL